VAAFWIAATVAPHDLAAQADADQDYVGPLVNQALESEKSRLEIPWHNPATGSSGMIMIERTFYRDPHTPCRDYRRTLERAGAPPVEIHGTGCRIGPGRWSLEEEGAKSGAAMAPTAGAGRAPAPQPVEPPDVEPGAGPAPASCPALNAVPVPCTKPPAVVDYTMPTRTKL
jgi:17 kDa outer membrane surface antigen